MCLNIWAPKSINFSFGTNGKLMVLSVPVVTYIRLHMNGIEKSYILSNYCLSVNILLQGWIRIANFIMHVKAV